MYQLVVLDLDMTIIDRNLAIPPRTRQVVADLRTAGVKVMIATGRMFCSARPFALQLGLHDMPLIAYNGALVKDVASGATLYHRPLDLSVAKAVARGGEWGVHWQAYLDDRLYVRALNEKRAAICRSPLSRPIRWEFALLYRASHQGVDLRRPARPGSVFRRGA